MSTEARQRVRVRFCLQPRRLRPLIRAPDLRPTEKESLLSRDAVDLFRPGLAFQRFFIRSVGDSQPAKVRDALAKNQFAVLVQTGLDFVTVKLFFHAAC